MTDEDQIKIRISDQLVGEIATLAEETRNDYQKIGTYSVASRNLGKLQEKVAEAKEIIDYLGTPSVTKQELFKEEEEARERFLKDFDAIYRCVSILEEAIVRDAFKNGAFRDAIDACAANAAYALRCAVLSVDTRFISERVPDECRMKGREYPDPLEPNPIPY